MQNYIKQLIDDIHNATLKVRPPSDTWMETEADPDNEAELEDLSYIEKYYGGQEEPISQITGIDPNLLPPAEKLSEEQQAILAIELEKLLVHYNFQLLFPENYPAYLKYPLIKEFWEEEHVALSFGMNEIEFCDMDDESFCPFEGYCTICEDEREQMKLDEEREQRIDDEEYELPEWVKNSDHTDSDWNGDFTVDDLFPKKEEIEAFIKQQKELGEVNNIDESYSVFYVKDELRFKMLDKQGNEINPDEIPVPGLCVICRKHQVEEFDEDIFCYMTRYEQKDSAKFRCRTYKKM